MKAIYLKEHRAWVQLVEKNIWIHWEGETYCLEKEEKKEKETLKPKYMGSDIIKAPMPGKIVSILRKENNKISAGDVVVVMEAMKTEYRLKAEKEGIVQKIFCKEGEQVELDQILVKIKE